MNMKNQKKKKFLVIIKIVWIKIIMRENKSILMISKMPFQMIKNGKPSVVNNI